MQITETILLIFKRTVKQKPNEGSYSRGSNTAILSRKIRAEACLVALTVRKPLIFPTGWGVNWVTLQGLWCEQEMRKMK